MSEIEPFKTRCPWCQSEEWSLIDQEDIPNGMSVTLKCKNCDHIWDEEWFKA